MHQSQRLSSELSLANQLKSIAWETFAGKSWRGEEEDRRNAWQAKLLISLSNQTSIDQTNWKTYFLLMLFPSRLTFPDWLVVKHLGECMDKNNFADLINMMANNLDDVDVDEEKVIGETKNIKACLRYFQNGFTFR